MLSSVFGKPGEAVLEKIFHFLLAESWNLVYTTYKFITSGQLMSFCDTCQKMKSDIDVTDMANRNFRIDGKSILGLMSIKLGLPMRLIVDGEDEELANEYFTKYEFE